MKSEFARCYHPILIGKTDHGTEQQIEVQSP
jgi:hypothetical protein